MSSLLNPYQERPEIIAPLNITETAPPSPRARLERVCKLLGRTVFGLEIHRTQRLLDYLETRSDIDVGRTAMYGISLGGHQTLFTVPLEPRTGAVGARSGWRSVLSFSRSGSGRRERDSRV